MISFSATFVPWCDVPIIVNGHQMWIQYQSLSRIKRREDKAWPNLREKRGRRGVYNCILDIKRDINFWFFLVHFHFCSKTWWNKWSFDFMALNGPTSGGNIPFVDSWVIYWQNHFEEMASQISSSINQEVSAQFPELGNKVNDGFE